MRIFWVPFFCFLYFPQGATLTVASRTRQAICEVHVPSTTLVYPLSIATCTSEYNTQRLRMISLLVHRLFDQESIRPFVKTAYADVPIDHLFQWYH